VEGVAWFDAAGIPVGLKSGYVWHDLRHEFVSHLLDQGYQFTR
jgi:hypothetical protein